MYLENVKSVYKLIPGNSHTAKMGMEVEICLHGTWIGHY